MPLIENNFSAVETPFWGVDIEELYQEPDTGAVTTTLLPIIATQEVATDLGHMFAEPSSTLSDNPFNFWASVTQGFDQLAVMQLCACAVHSGISSGFDMSTSSLFSFQQPWEQSFMPSFEHHDHEHCECGGHFHDGVCDKCGKRHVH
jgi:hypothetical protein